MLNIIDAVELPFPKRACADGERRGQIHTRKQIVGTCEWCGSVSRSILIIRSDGNVDTGYLDWKM